MDYYIILTGLFLLGVLAGAGLVMLVLLPGYSRLKRDHALLESRSEHLQSALEERSEQLLHLEQQKSALAGESIRLREENARLHAQLEAAAESGEKLKRAQQEHETGMRIAFENIANRIFEEKSDRFTQVNESKIKGVLEPLGKEIESFRKKLEENYLNQTKERTSLGTELRQLMELNRRLSDDATALTKALKGEQNPKMQGDWGEMILDSILSNSGLVKDVHYFPQECLKTEDGKTLRPDVIVRYPDSREIIIDSKVSLNAYSRYVNAGDEMRQASALKEHLTAVRRHIDDLNGKRYHDYAGSLDFVMMFMPVEPAYLLTVNKDENLWEYAYKRKILLVSPTHLITALKLVYDLWKRDSQNKNALQIAERGALMYDKFTAFVNDMLLLEKGISNTQKAYDSAMNKLSQGKGNLIRQAELLKELGVKTEKELSVPANEHTLPGSILSETSLSESAGSESQPV